MTPDGTVQALHGPDEEHRYMTSGRPDGDPGAEQRRETQHVDDMIDEAGRESFPASDPMAITPPHRPAGPGGGAKADDRHAPEQGSEGTRPPRPTRE